MADFLQFVLENRVLFLQICGPHCDLVLLDAASVARTLGGVVVLLAPGPVPVILGVVGHKDLHTQQAYALAHINNTIVVKHTVYKDLQRK